jgi:hypothetical protein
MENPYVRAPLRVALYDPEGQRVTSTIVFLGGAPGRVVAAAKKAKERAAGGVSWGKADAATLRKFYGPSWIKKISPVAGLTEGGSSEFGDLGDFDTGVVVAPKEAVTRTVDKGRVVYSRLGVFPEDTYENVKNKIYAATDILPACQHLFYEPIGGGATTTYRILVDGAPVATDIRAMAEGSEVVAGLPVDREMEADREDLVVEAFDTLRVLGRNSPPLWVVGLRPLLESHAVPLRTAISDKYQRDLLYYGFVLKYWPQFSLEAFCMFVSDFEEFAERFPKLFPFASVVVEKMELEGELLGNMYTRASLAAGKVGYDSVTSATVRIKPPARIAVNIRNVFDHVGVSRRVPAAVARIPATEMGVGRRRDYIAEKAHSSAAISKSGVAASMAAIELGRFFGCPPKKLGVSFAILRKRARFTRPRFVFLTIYSTGEYTLRSTWSEDDRANFAKITAQMTEAARPILDQIDALGAAAFPIGGSFANQKSSSMGGITVSAFWPHALTSEGFREMKSRWRLYERAGIVGVRGLQQAGAYAFYYRKGIVAYPPAVAEKVTPQGSQGVTNQYAHLTDPEAGLRWDAAFAGRLVRVYHRVTDLRVEVLGVDLEEFLRIRRMVFAFLEGLVKGPDRLRRGVIPPGQSRSVEGRLRSLQERDPDLFDLKKYDSEATVYSVLCQGDRQPELLTGKEVAAMRPGRAKSSLVKFWNFTANAPAYYRCPSKKFPHLHFGVGKHPLGYCLPCCKKARAMPQTKMAAINRACIRDHSLPEGVAGLIDDEAASRHVLSYGKRIPVGRVAHVPVTISEGLLFDTIDKPFVFRLVGVPQRTATIRGAGYFFSAATVVGLEHVTFLQDLVETARLLGPTYLTVAAGRAVVFDGPDSLADALLEAFGAPAGARVAFTAFSPGGIAGDIWQEIVADLVRIRYDVEILIFTDEEGVGISLEASAAADARLRAVSVPVDVAMFLRTVAGTYPIMAMDQKSFLRHTGGRGPARRYFSSSYDKEDVSDCVVKVLRTLLVYQQRNLRGGCRDAFGLDSVMGFCRASSIPVVYVLVNLHNLVYGVVLEGGAAGAWVYLPVPQIPYFLPPKSGKASAFKAFFGPRPRGKYPAAALARTVKKLQGWGRKECVVTPAARLVDAAKNCVGFVALGSEGPLYYHHDATPDTKKLPWGRAAVASVPYGMCAVDCAIHTANGAAQSPLPEDKIALADRARYRHSLYDLFAAEFAALLQGERDTEMRKRLHALVAATRFRSPVSYAQFRARLSEMLSPEDNRAVGEVVAQVVHSSPGQAGRDIQKAIGSEMFGFDRMTLQRLRRLGNHARVVKELGALMSSRVELVPDAGGRTENIFVACSLPTSTARPQCDGDRLRLPQDRYAPFLSILAADILNPTKTTAVGDRTSGTVDGWHFIRRPGERIRVR